MSGIKGLFKKIKKGGSQKSNSVLSESYDEFVTYQNANKSPNSKNKELLPVIEERTGSQKYQTFNVSESARQDKLEMAMFFVNDEYF